MPQKKKPMKIWDVNVDNIVISKLVTTKTDSKYLIGQRANLMGLYSRGRGGLFIWGVVRGLYSRGKTL